MSSPKKQSKVLMNNIVDFAEKMLNAHGEFHPFGGYLDAQEEIVHVGLSPSGHWTSDQHRSDALAESLRSLAREKRPIAFGIVTNVSFKGDAGASDAIRVFLEHASGYCADVFFHYTLAPGHEVRINNVTAQQGLPYLFSDGKIRS